MEDGMAGKEEKHVFFTNIAERDFFCLLTCARSSFCKRHLILRREKSGRRKRIEKKSYELVAGLY